MLQSTGSQRVGHERVTELTDCNSCYLTVYIITYVKIKIKLL